MHYAPALLAKAAGLPILHTIQRPFGNRSRSEALAVKHRHIARLAHGLTTRFVALGRYYREDQIARWHIPPDRILLNPIGIDQSLVCCVNPQRENVLREFDLPADTLLVGIVARLAQRKGIAAGIKWFSQLHRRLPRTHLLIVGDGPQRALLEALRTELGMQGHVTFAGANADVARFLSAFDIFMQTTENPLNGISAIEAMAAGKPIVTLARCPEDLRMAADTCEEDVNGMYLRDWSSEEDVARLARLLTSPSELHRLGETSKRLAQERFDINQHAQVMADLYLQLATQV